MSGIYAVAAEQMVSGAFNWAAGSWSLQLIGPGYTPSFGTDTTLASILSGALVGTPVALTGIATSNGYCMAGSVGGITVSAGTVVAGAVVLENIGGASSTWPLVCYLAAGAAGGQAGSSGISGGVLVGLTGAVSVLFSATGLFRP
jgi:hypothetical protein